MRTRIPSTALFLLVFILLSGLTAGCGGEGQSAGGSGGDAGQQGGAGEDGGGAPAETKIALGKVRDVQPDKRRIVVRLNEEIEGESRISLRVKENAKIELDNKPAELSDIEAGQQAQVEYSVVNGKERARSVQLFEGGGGSESTGG